jgi:shikimate kinase
MAQAAEHRRIYLVGMMGSGKSYWAGKLGHYYGLPAYDLDRLLESATNKTIRQIFEEEGETTFRTMESDMLSSGIPSKKFILACGGGTPCFFDNMAFMKSNGIVVWFNPSTSELVKRLSKGIETRPVLGGIESIDELTTHVENLLEKRNRWYGQADIVIEDDLPQLPGIIEKINLVEQGSN